MRKRLISLLLCAFLLVSAVMPAWAEEAEPAEEVLTEKIVVSNEEEFLAFAENCRLDAYSENLEVILVVDLDLTGYEFHGVPIFSGIFDGRGHEITGLNITEEGSAQGLFRYLTGTAIVKDLSVSGVVQPGGSKNEVGAIAGRNGGQILNCHFYGTLSGNDYVGGIAGVNRVSGVIENCSAGGDFHGNHFVGGIAGENNGVIRNCGNRAAINTTPQQNGVEISDITLDTLTNTENVGTVTDIGGIAGISSGVIRGCENTGDVGYPHMGYNIGGIAGTQTGYIVDCKNSGNIQGRKEIGGIVGQLEPVSQIEYTEDTLQILQGQLDTMSGLVNQASGNAQANANEVAAQLENLQDQADTARDAVGTLIPDEENPELPDMDTVIAAQNTLTTALDAMPNTLSSAASAAQDTVYGLTRDLNAISGQIGAMGQTVSNASENLGGSATDVSDQDTPELLTAKVENCENLGGVLADLNAGGIAGAMAMENDMDVLEDWLQTGETSLNFQAEVRAVVLNCRNSGTVTGAKQNAGGIAGWQSLGLVKECSNTGRVDGGASGSYIGGISGLSTGYLRSNHTKCEVLGNTYVGGIAGSGTVVSDSLSWVKLTGAVEKRGAVLGYAEEPQTETETPVNGNIYLCVEPKWGAIDGIDYSGKAEPMDLDTFMGQENLPALFETVTVRFLFDDGTERQAQIRPGSSLSVTVFPTVPEKNGTAGTWIGPEDAELENILFDMTFEVQYTAHHATLQSQETQENSRPILLLEGAFTDKATVSVVQSKESPVLNDKEQLLGAWEISVSETATTAHFLLPENTDTESLKMLMQDESGNWNEVSFTQDGSYLVFALTQSKATIALVQTEQNNTALYIASAGILVATVAIICGCKRKRIAIRRRNPNLKWVKIGSVILISVLLLVVLGFAWLYFTAYPV